MTLFVGSILQNIQNPALKKDLKLSPQGIINT